MWRPGSKLVHPYNADLGTGVVQKVDGRFLNVYFPMAEQEIVLSSEGSGLTRLILSKGHLAEILETGEEIEIVEAQGHDYLLSDGRVIADAEIWPLAPPDTPIERLATLRVDPLESFKNRIDGLRLMELREAGGLGSFLGGRIDLFPHQLHTGLQAVENDPVRWLLADEVGLGKTIEACLILSALVRTGRAKRALIVAPDALVIQWLGELYRKFHQIFVVLDEERIESVEKDYGEGVNPFDVHPYAVISYEAFLENPALRGLAGEAEPDLIVVDEAHRLVDAAVNEHLAPLIDVAKHALLLTATPLQADREGFYHLLSLLHPEAFPTFEAFDQALESGEAIVPCTSSVRREDIGGLPPRVPIAIDLPSPTEDVLSDPRTLWILEQAQDWQENLEKALIFVHDLETLTQLQRFLETETRTRVFAFHEEVSSEQRDIDIAMFRESVSPILLCSEAGEEGRNFQFCDRMVHFDLPLSPVALEQRIGRLDRIGRDMPVEIVYFRHEGVVVDLARFYEKLDLFEKPGAGLALALSNAEPLLKKALESGSTKDLESLVEETLLERESSDRNPLQVLYRDGYEISQAESIMNRVPNGVQKLTQRFCLNAAHELGFDVVEKGGEATFYIEIGAGSRIDALPGLPGGSRMLGTFQRGEAIHRDELDFFSNGHPLVEGLLLELEDGPRARATLMEIPYFGLSGAGIFAIFKDGADWRGVVIDASGKLQPDWVPQIWKNLKRTKEASAADWGVSVEWADGIRGLGMQLEEQGELVAAAFFRFVS